MFDSYSNNITSRKKSGGGNKRKRVTTVQYVVCFVNKSVYVPAQNKASFVGECMRNHCAYKMAFNSDDDENTILDKIKTKIGHQDINFVEIATIDQRQAFKHYIFFWSCNAYHDHELFDSNAARYWSSAIGHDGCLFQDYSTPM